LRRVSIEIRKRNEADAKQVLTFLRRTAPATEALAEPGPLVKGKNSGFIAVSRVGRPEGVSTNLDSSGDMLLVKCPAIGAASMACCAAGGGRFGNGINAVGSARSGLPKGSWAADSCVIGIACKPKSNRGGGKLLTPWADDRGA